MENLDANELLADLHRWELVISRQLISKNELELFENCLLFSIRFFLLFVLY